MGNRSFLARVTDDTNCLVKVLGIKAGSFTRAVCALDHRRIFPASPKKDS